MATSVNSFEYEAVYIRNLATKYNVAESYHTAKHNRTRLHNITVMDVSIQKDLNKRQWIGTIRTLL